MAGHKYFKLVKVMGPLICAKCGARLTEGSPEHPDHGPVTGPTPGCGVCDRFALGLLTS